MQAKPARPRPTRNRLLKVRQPSSNQNPCLALRRPQVRSLLPARQPNPTQRQKNTPRRPPWLTKPLPETLPTAPRPQASPPTWAHVAESTITANPARKFTNGGDDDRT